MERLSRFGIGAVIIIYLLTASCQNVPEQSNVIRIATGNLGVFVQAEKYDEEGNPLVLKGIGVEYLKWLIEKYNLKPEITKFYPATNESDVYSLMVLSSNGTWMGALGDVVHNVSDLALAIANPRPEYIPHFRVTYPLWASSYSMFVPYPGTDNQAWSLLRPFSFWTWILLLISFFVTPFSMYLLSKASTRSRATGKVTYYFLVNYFLTVITGQGHRPPLRKFRNAVIVAMVWCLGGVVLVNAYKGLLISNLTLQVSSPIVNSYSELIREPEVKFFTFNNSEAYYKLLTAAYGDKKLLGEILSKNPDRILPTYLKCLEQVEKGPYVCFAPTMIGDIVTEKRARETGSCTMTRVGDPVVISNPSLPLRKDYVLANEISEAVIEARSFGLDQKWLLDYQPPDRHCKFEKIRPKEKLSKLGMKHMTGPFILLGAGLGLSLICFILEHVVFILNKKKLLSRRSKLRSSLKI